MRLIVLASLALLVTGCGGGAFQRLNPNHPNEAQYRLGGCQLRGHGVCKDMQEFEGPATPAQ
ncbi:hypothetical protein M8997_007625 [Phyllobacterium sp. 21LDTY02-6]|jgi:hypothetical protein|uniref:hypothetical protein n=1 Tax=unclassified Phyllobacterium TaxID=2638441 RepID=UPI0020206EBD|nr:MULTISPECIES: hypothetical protein [unclassified Phyllobacterium]MCO4317049.1 hypothetical protein [Phyllobacterium sp. 21LDTY02-6]MCX8278613.1 hypothetical protein [Phyllobacterium sp. 0TCS1.6C]MCX8293557.1 hypothetical protein [Phyllobacterium sp. 0TCS1.6A]